MASIKRIDQKQTQSQAKNTGDENFEALADQFGEELFNSESKVEQVTQDDPLSRRLDPPNDMASLAVLQVHAESNTLLEEHGYLGMKIFAFPKPQRLGRPRVLNEHSKLMICQLLQMGSSRREASVYVRCAPSTITRAIQRDPQFAEEVERSEMMGVLIPRVLIFKAAKKSWRAARWLAEDNEKQAKIRHRENAIDAKAELQDAAVQEEKRRWRDASGAQAGDAQNGNDKSRKAPGGHPSRDTEAKIAAPRTAAWPADATGRDEAPETNGRHNKKERQRRKKKLKQALSKGRKQRARK